MKHVCAWCAKPVVTPKKYKKGDKIACSIGCRDAETLFCNAFSDEEITRRAHYKELTTGDDDE